MKSTLIVLLLVLTVTMAGCVSNQVQTGDQTLEDGTIVKSDGTMVKPDGTMVKPDGTMIKPDGTMIKPDGTMIAPNGTMMDPEEKMMEAGNTSFSGTKLAGDSSPLLDFNKIDYDAALKTDKLIVLYFYAKWCPICIAEVPELYAAFNGLQTDKVIGFRVNFNDGDTDQDEINLARQFGVPYQHTKVFVKNNQSVLKSSESWNKNRYVSEINNAIA